MVMMDVIDTKRKIELFFEHKINVHIETIDGRFNNGLILELGSDFLLMQERILGQTFILFSQIVLVEPYKPKEEGEC
jgi:hypothetical protein